MTTRLKNLIQHLDNIVEDKIPQPRNNSLLQPGENLIDHVCFSRGNVIRDRDKSLHELFFI